MTKEIICTARLCFNTSNSCLNYLQHECRATGSAKAAWHLCNEAKEGEKGEAAVLQLLDLQLV